MRRLPSLTCPSRPSYAFSLALEVGRAPQLHHPPSVTTRSESLTNGVIPISASNADNMCCDSTAVVSSQAPAVSPWPVPLKLRSSSRTAQPEVGKGRAFDALPSAIDESRSKDHRVVRERGEKSCHTTATTIEECVTICGEERAISKISTSSSNNSSSKSRGTRCLPRGSSLQNAKKGISPIIGDSTSTDFHSKDKSYNDGHGGTSSLPDMANQSRENVVLDFQGQKKTVSTRDSRNVGCMENIETHTQVKGAFAVPLSSTFSTDSFARGTTRVSGLSVASSPRISRSPQHDTPYPFSISGCSDHRCLTRRAITKPSDASTVALYTYASTCPISSSSGGSDNKNGSSPNPVAQSIKPMGRGFPLDSSCRVGYTVEEETVEEARASLSGDNTGTGAGLLIDCGVSTRAEGAAAIPHWSLPLTNTAIAHTSEIRGGDTGVLLRRVRRARQAAPQQSAHVLSSTKGVGGVQPSQSVGALINNLYVPDGSLRFIPEGASELDELVLQNQQDVVESISLSENLERKKSGRKRTALVMSYNDKEEQSAMRSLISVPGSRNHRLSREERRMKVSYRRATYCTSPKRLERTARRPIVLRKALARLIMRVRSEQEQTQSLARPALLNDSNTYTEKADQKSTVVSSVEPPSPSSSSTRPLALDLVLSSTFNSSSHTFDPTSMCGLRRQLQLLRSKKRINFLKSQQRESHIAEKGATAAPASSLAVDLLNQPLHGEEDEVSDENASTTRFRPNPSTNTETGASATAQRVIPIRALRHGGSAPALHTTMDDLEALMDAGGVEAVGAAVDELTDSIRAFAEAQVNASITAKKTAESRRSEKGGSNERDTPTNVCETDATASAAPLPRVWRGSIRNKYANDTSPSLEDFNQKIGDEEFSALFSRGILMGTPIIKGSFSLIPPPLSSPEALEGTLAVNFKTATYIDDEHRRFAEKAFADSVLQNLGLGDRQADDCSSMTISPTHSAQKRLPRRQRDHSAVEENGESVALCEELPPNLRQHAKALGLVEKKIKSSDVENEEREEVPQITKLEIISDRVRKKEMETVVTNAAAEVPLSATENIARSFSRTDHLYASITTDSDASPEAVPCAKAAVSSAPRSLVLRYATHIDMSRDGSEFLLVSSRVPPSREAVVRLTGARITQGMRVASYTPFTMEPQLFPTSDKAQVEESGQADDADFEVTIPPPTPSSSLSSLGSPYMLVLRSLESSQEDAKYLAPSHLNENRRATLLARFWERSRVRRSIRQAPKRMTGQVSREYPITPFTASVDMEVLTGPESHACFINHFRGRAEVEGVEGKKVEPSSEAKGDELPCVAEYSLQDAEPDATSSLLLPDNEAKNLPDIKLRSGAVLARPPAVYAFDGDPVTMSTGLLDTASTFNSETLSLERAGVAWLRGSVVRRLSIYLDDKGQIMFPHDGRTKLLKGKQANEFNQDRRKCILDSINLYRKMKGELLVVGTIPEFSSLPGTITLLEDADQKDCDRTHKAREPEKSVACIVSAKEALASELEEDWIKIREGLFLRPGGSRIEFLEDLFNLRRARQLSSWTPSDRERKEVHASSLADPSQRMSSRGNYSLLIPPKTADNSIKTLADATDIGAEVLAHIEKCELVNRNIANICETRLSAGVTQEDISSQCKQSNSLRSAAYLERLYEMDSHEYSALAEREADGNTAETRKQRKENGDAPDYEDTDAQTVEDMCDAAELMLRFAFFSGRRWVARHREVPEAFYAYDLFMSHFNGTSASHLEKAVLSKEKTTLPELLFCAHFGHHPDEGRPIDKPFAKHLLKSIRELHQLTPKLHGATMDYLKREEAIEHATRGSSSYYSASLASPSPSSKAAASFLVVAATFLSPSRGMGIDSRSLLLHFPQKPSRLRISTPSPENHQPTPTSSCRNPNQSGGTFRGTPVHCAGSSVSAGPSVSSAHHLLSVNSRREYSTRSRRHPSVDDFPSSGNKQDNSDVPMATTQKSDKELGGVEDYLDGESVVEKVDIYPFTFRFFNGVRVDDIIAATKAVASNDSDAKQQQLAVRALARLALVEGCGQSFVENMLSQFKNEPTDGASSVSSHRMQKEQATRALELLTGGGGAETLHELLASSGWYERSNQQATIKAQQEAENRIDQKTADAKRKERFEAHLIAAAEEAKIIDRLRCLPNSEEVTATPTPSVGTNRSRKGNPTSPPPLVEDLKTHISALNEEEHTVFTDFFTPESYFSLRREIIARQKLKQAIVSTAKARAERKQKISEFDRFIQKSYELGHLQVAPDFVKNHFLDAKKVSWRSRDAVKQNEIGCDSTNSVSAQGEESIPFFARVGLKYHYRVGAALWRQAYLEKLEEKVLADRSKIFFIAQQKSKEIIRLGKGKDGAGRQGDHSDEASTNPPQSISTKSEATQEKSASSSSKSKSANRASKAEESGQPSTGNTIDDDTVIVDREIEGVGEKDDIDNTASDLADELTEGEEEETRGENPLKTEETLRRRDAAYQGEADEFGNFGFLKASDLTTEILERYDDSRVNMEQKAYRLSKIVRDGPLAPTVIVEDETSQHVSIKRKQRRRVLAGSMVLCEPNSMMDSLTRRFFSLRSQASVITRLIDRVTAMKSSTKYISMPADVFVDLIVPHERTKPTPEILEEQRFFVLRSLAVMELVVAPKNNFYSDLSKRYHRESVGAHTVLEENHPTTPNSSSNRGRVNNETAWLGSSKSKQQSCVKQEENVENADLDIMAFETIPLSQDPTLLSILEEGPLFEPTLLDTFSFAIKNRSGCHESNIHCDGDDKNKTKTSAKGGKRKSAPSSSNSKGTRSSPITVEDVRGAETHFTYLRPTLAMGRDACEQQQQQQQQPVDLAHNTASSSSIALRFSGLNSSYDSVATGLPLKVLSKRSDALEAFLLERLDSQMPVRLKTAVDELLLRRHTNGEALTKKQEKNVLVEKTTAILEPCLPSDVEKELMCRTNPDVQRLRLGVLLTNALYHYRGPPTIINHPIPFLRITPSRYLFRDVSLVAAKSAISILQEYSAIRKNQEIGDYLREHSNGFLSPIPTTNASIRSLLDHPLPSAYGVVAYAAHQERVFGTIGGRSVFDGVVPKVLSPPFNSCVYVKRGALTIGTDIDVMNECSRLENEKLAEHKEAEAIGGSKREKQSEHSTQRLFAGARVSDEHELTTEVTVSRDSSSFVLIQLIDKKGVQHVFRVEKPSDATKEEMQERCELIGKIVLGEINRLNATEESDKLAESHKTHTVPKRLRFDSASNIELCASRENEEDDTTINHCIAGKFVEQTTIKKRQRRRRMLTPEEREEEERLVEKAIQDYYDSCREHSSGGYVVPTDLHVEHGVMPMFAEDKASALLHETVHTPDTQGRRILAVTSRLLTEKEALNKPIADAASKLVVSYLDMRPSDNTSDLNKK